MRNLLFGGVLVLAASVGLAEGLEDELVNHPSEYRRKKAAAELSKTGDVEAIHRGVLQIVKNDSEANRKFLIDMVTSETNPMLRYRYGLGLERMGAAETGPMLAAQLGGLKPEAQVLGVEILGLLPWKGRDEALLELARSPDRMVATEAFRALARSGSKKLIDAILAAATAHPDEKAAIRGGWAAADIVGDTKPLLGKLAKLERTLEGAGLARVVAIRESFQDSTYGMVFKYRKTSLEPVEQWFTKRKPKVVVDPEGTKKIESALEKLKTVGSWYELVARAFDEISATEAVDTIDFKNRVFHFRASNVSSLLWTDEHFAYALVRGAAMMLLHDTRDLHWYRRGFEQGLKNSFWFIEAHPDLAPDGALTAFIDDQLRPDRWAKGG